MERKRREDEKDAIDRITELRITRQRINNETKQKNMTNLERTNKNISKQGQRKYYQLEQFGK